MALIGVGILASSPFLNAYSYTVTSVSADSKNITITYVYPLQPLTLVFLLCGPVLSVYGFWKGRGLLALHSSNISSGFVAGIILTVASLVNVVHILGTSYEAIDYGFPLPWLIYGIDSLMQIHRWFLTPAIFLDFAFWVVIALAGLASATALRDHIKRESH